MRKLNVNLKPIVAAISIVLLVSAPVFAQDVAKSAHMDQLFERLKSADEGEARKIEREIRRDWQLSGSPAMDLLLRRGKDALDTHDTDKAIEHFSALIDHAPEFAEGWHGRAMAFFQADSFGMAIADLEQTLALNPRHLGAIYGLGVILQQMDREGDAYDMFKQLEALNPNHENLAQSLARLEKRVNGAEL